MTVPLEYTPTPFSSPLNPRSQGQDARGKNSLTRNTGAHGRLTPPPGRASGCCSHSLWTDAGTPSPHSPSPHTHLLPTPSRCTPFSHTHWSPHAAPQVTLLRHSCSPHAVHAVTTARTPSGTHTPLSHTLPPSTPGTPASPPAPPHAHSPRPHSPHSYTPHSPAFRTHPPSPRFPAALPRPAPPPSFRGRVSGLR